MYNKYTGIILKKHPIGEADEMLTIFTRESGKMRVKARSTRKIASRLSGHLQSLNEIEFETASRSKRSASNSLPVLISVRVVTLNNYLRENLQKFAWALVGTESLYRLTGDNDENQDLYRRFLSYLVNIRDKVNENFATRKFQLELLEMLGFGIDMSEFERDEKEIISELLNNNPRIKVAKGTEKKIEQMIQNVLEREVRSEKFARETK